ELRNPLGVVLNSLFMLRRTVGDPEAAEPHLAMAERHTERAVGLAQDLTSYMREREPHPEPVDLKVALSEVLETIDRPTGVEVVDDVSALLLEADTQQLAQIFTNLVSNAYEAMPEGGVLRVSSRTEDGSVVMAFEDSGDGIDDELRERLFEPFVTTKSEGTGLGLAIVRRLAEAHGGTVSIENGTDRGAVVSVVLPLRSPVEP
ncbi:MAG: sensor histidine kinase, partial [Acidimicrobiales bacterium]